MENVSENVELFNAFKRTERYIFKEVKEVLDKYNLTPCQFNVLEKLYNTEELSIKSLIELNSDSSGNMTVVLKNLEKSKLITRKVNPDDSRSYLFKNTKDGNALIEKVLSDYYVVVDKFFENFNEKNRKRFLKLTKKICHLSNSNDDE